MASYSVSLAEVLVRTPPDIYEGYACSALNISSKHISLLNKVHWGSATETVRYRVYLGLNYTTLEP